MPFVPETYILPGDKEGLQAAVARDRKTKAPSFWLGKPRNEYAGRGISIFAGGSQLFKDAAATKHIGVVQR